MNIHATQLIEPDDPLFDNQWHLFKSGSAQVNINLSDVWSDYTGEGVVVGVIEGAVQWTHPDLIANYDTGLDFSGTDNSADVSANGASAHATAVAGLIAADANGEGVVGVAHDSTLVSYHADFTGSFYSAFERIMDVAIDGNSAYGIDRGADIINNSWAFTFPFAGNFNAPFVELLTMGNALEEAAEVGREGLGTVMLWAAGNDRNDDSGQWANGSNVTNSPHTIAVAAVDAEGDVARYSNPGANLLISAPSSGGSLAIATTTTGSGYTFGFGGTSAATPIVSGVTALMLEANPELGYRDVQEILAYSARHTVLRDLSQPDDEVDWTLNAAENWNGGGLLHSNDFGFGLIDAHAAVRLAESWDRQQVYGDRQIAGGSDQQASVSFEFGSPTLEASINVSAGFAVEHAEVTLDLSHARADHLFVELIAPSGTRSVLMDGNGGNSSFPGSSFALSSTAFWGEDSAGTWQIEVTDRVAGTSGTFSGWTLTLYGKDTADSLADVYVFTDEYSDFAAGDASRLSLTDDDSGSDTVNAAPVTTDSVIDLGGGTSLIDGIAVDIDQGIENAIGGDGDDRLIGNASSNSLTGGRGDDTLEGGAGADSLSGGAGFDVASYASATARVSVRFDNLARNEGDAAGDSYSSIEAVIGSSHNDYLRGDRGLDNHFEGLGGDDVFLGLGGANSLYGGEGKDRFYSGQDGDLIDGGAGIDSVFYASSGSGVLVDLQSGVGQFGFAEGDRLSAVENLYGSNHNDTLSGDGGANQLVGQAGDDILMGLGGSDRLFGREGNDTLIGGDGGDRLDGGAGFDVASYEQSSSGLIVDLLSTGRSSGETVGDDYVSIEGVRGSAFGDGLYGDSNGNMLDGFDGNDVIVGRAGANSILGGGGNDRIYSGSNADLIDGGADVDSVYYAYSDVGVAVDLLDGVGQFGSAEGDRLSAVENLYGSDHGDTLHGDQGANLIVGQDGDDFLLGRGGNDRLLGRDGNDALEGGEDDDRLEGGEGDDVLSGGAGNDRLFGDLGADVFVFRLGDGTDRIGDFDPANDLLDFTSWGLNSFSQLDVRDGGKGAEISFDSGDQLILDGVEAQTVDDTWAIWG